MKTLLVLPFILLAGCACKPVTVEVMVPVACVGKKPVRPYLVADSELAVMGEGQIVLALEAHRTTVMLYVDELEAVAEGCSKLAAK